MYIMVFAYKVLNLFLLGNTEKFPFTHQIHRIMIKYAAVYFLAKCGAGIELRI